jgi:thiamine pyrophosphokinase
VVVFAGGDRVPAGLGGVLPPEAYVIAADSGIEQAQTLGWPIDLAVGDFDSVSPEALAAAERAGARIERHPAAKDATDLELALAAAAALEPREIVVAGGAGGRLDHLLGGILALAGADASSTGAEIRAYLGPARIHVVRSQVVLDGEPGEIVTLLALDGPAHGITTSGLLYPLADESLLPGSTRGVSNELVGGRATVTVGSGVLLAVLPGELGTHQHQRHTETDTATHPPSPSPGGPTS